MSRARRLSPRALCAQVLCEVVERRRYLDVVLQERLPHQAEHAALIQEMAYGTLRWYHQLDAIAAQLLQHPLKEKDSDLYLLLLLGLYQLRGMRVATHAVVDETVAAAEALGKPWAKGLINACLRAYLRDINQGGKRAEGIVERDPVARFSHPAWLIDMLRQDRPTAWESILEANNARPPLTLRVNVRVQSRAAYLQQLHDAGIGAAARDLVPSAITLDTPVSVTQLPGFAHGAVSVQDAAAQVAAVLLDVQPGHTLLDACAAPGGKTAQLLESSPDLDLLALDNDAARVGLIEQNLKRLGLRARVKTADAAEPQTWWDQRPFDRILADVPCSATGVIRRHPDIKLRRQPEDLEKLCATQARLLEGLWPTLRTGGKLLYVTCSVLAAENEHQVAAFLTRHTDAQELALTVAGGEPLTHGVQLLPGVHGTDGFFYACLVKTK